MVRRTAVGCIHALLIASAMFLGGCNDEPNVMQQTSAEAAAPSSAAPPRRPSRRFYFSRTSERCEIFMEDGDDRTTPLATPCPEYLRAGERIRVAGKTCLLENKAEPEREMPVVCPDPLTRFEKEIRAAEAQ